MFGNNVIDPKIVVIFMSGFFTKIEKVFIIKHTNFGIVTIKQLIIFNSIIVSIQIALGGIACDVDLFVTFSNLPGSLV